MGSSFATTQWTQVLAARDGTDTAASEALAELCERYWVPLFSFIRRQGHDLDEAADLTQAYFAYLLEKELIQVVEPSAGRFRSFLLASLRHFLSHERERARAQKRGGRTPVLSFDAAEAEARYGLEPIDRLTPEAVFEHRWALTILERALARLQQEQNGENAERFERLKGYLTGQRPASRYAEVADELGMTEAAVRTAIHRLRRRFGQLLRHEVADTVAAEEDVDDEVRHLLSVVGPLEPRRRR